MEPQSLTDVVGASRAAVSTLTALAVQYSFSIVGAIILLVVGWIASRYLHRWALFAMDKCEKRREILPQRERRGCAAVAIFDVEARIDLLAPAFRSRFVGIAGTCDEAAA